MKVHLLVLSLFACLAFGATANLVPEAQRVLEIAVKEPGKTAIVYKRFALPQKTEALLLTADVKYDGVVAGKQKWFDARIMTDFVDAAGKKIGNGPAIGGWKGTADWTPIRKAFEVPSGATAIALMPGFLNAQAGSFALRNLSLEPMQAIDVAFEGYERSQALPVPGTCASEPLMTVSNRLVSMKTGREVWLQGVAIASLEWSAGGDHIMTSVSNAVEKWNANVVRLALRSDFWFGHGPWQNPKNGAAKYHELVDRVAEYLQAHGKYLVVDLHEFRAPTWKHVSFWLDVSTRYRNHPGVIFGLLNEPHDIPWEVWRNGGQVSDKKKAGVIAENKEAIRSFDSVGMQKLLDTVRANGAGNVVTAGGLDWAYDLSGVLNGYALAGSNIVYETHVYPWKRGWQKAFLDAAARHPILMGEVGAQPTPMPFESPKSFIPPEAWVPGMLATIQQYRINWTAWCFHPRSSPCLIGDWDYTPTPYWGKQAKAALGGQRFEQVKIW